jgi:divalent metal cation (Fe/Co/Zn/Cd) transporter
VIIPESGYSSIIEHERNQYNEVVTHERDRKSLWAIHLGPHPVINLTIGIDGSLTVRQGDRIATNMELLIYESIPNIRHIHVHYHPAEAARRGMSIEEILAETRKHVAEHESFVNELQESRALP